MKKLAYIVFMGVFALSTSCKKYLDINQNPNTATTSTPELILPQALTATASLTSSYNTMGSQLGGYQANAGGYSGFGANVTYSFSASDYGGLWSSTYDNLEDYQYILDNTDTLPDYAFFNGAARIMKAMDFQVLVDTYNDVPYSQALKGINKLTPAYDKAQDIYVSLGNQLDSAIASIKAGQNNSNAVVLDKADVMFKGDMNKWIQLANTVKLRIMIHGQGKINLANKTFDAAGFLTDDAIVNPGYIKDNGKQNPQWNAWVTDYTGAAANRAWIPTKWILSFFDGRKLDDYRGYAIYNGFPNSASNQLGILSSNTPSSPADGSWNSKQGGIGILKGPSQGQPIITAAETYFLRAEAGLNGLTAETNTQVLFEAGIRSSFKYLYRFLDGSFDLNSWDPTADADAYFDNNPTSRLVHFDLATTKDQQLEAIITQKYVALNFINGNEGWNEYRRTQFPKIVNGSSDPLLTFASTQSTSTRPDKLPTRIQYPSSENSYNPEHVPTDITPFTSLIFWAKP